VTEPDATTTKRASNTVGRLVFLAIEYGTQRSHLCVLKDSGADQRSNENAEHHRHRDRGDV